MLEHTNRKSLVDLLRPPYGYRLETAFGTTYSLDFVTLTAILMAFMDREADDEGKPEHRVNALQAFVRLSKRVRIFVNRGSMLHPRHTKENRVANLYDQMVREVSFRQASFHPKVWLIWYTPRAMTEASGPIVRLICSSRNSTTSQNWELAAALDGSSAGQKTQIGQQASVFMRKILEGAPAADRELFRPLLGQLSQTEFDTTREMQNCDFRWQWHGGSSRLWRNIPAAGKVLVMSPFLSEGFLKQLLNRFAKVTLISTRQALDDVTDGLMTDLAEHELFYVEQEHYDEVDASLGLHAKFYIFEGKADRSNWLGSANASPSAWQGRNCEAMLNFSPGISIQQFKTQFIYRGKDEYQGWISEYAREERSDPTDEEAAERKARKDVEDAHTAISSLEIKAHYSQAEQSITLQSLIDFFPADWVTTTTCHITLLSLIDRRSHSSNSVNCLDKGIIFDDVSVADLTDFVVIEINHPLLDSKNFILKAETNFSDYRHDRETAVLREILNKKNFQAFLNSILFDKADLSYRAASTPSTRNGKGWSGSSHTNVLDATMEEILEACTEDPSRVREISDILKTFKDTDHVNEEFRLFWEAFKKALQSHAGEKS
jgi:hypothetical protein